MLRTLLGLLLLPALAYLALCGWIYAKQRDFMYFPQFTRNNVPPANLELPVEGAVLRGWVVNPGRRDAILYFGGNAESVEAMRGDLAQWFPGHSTYLLHYRGYGASGGRPDEQALFADALAQFDHVRSRHPDGSIAVLGRSLGSGVASYLASRRPVAKLVLITPFDSMANVGQAHYRWLPVRWLLSDRYESVRHLRKYPGPILVIRAGEDQVIPPASTDRLIAALGRRPQVVALPGDHNSVSAHPGYRRALIDFLGRPAGAGPDERASGFQPPAQNRW
jgi:uncharacterized protein